MNDKIYNILKWIVLIALPALSTFIFGLSNLWGFDSSVVIASIAVLETFLGSLIGVSTYQYNKNLDQNNSKEENKNGDE